MMSDYKTDYWEEAIGCALDECGLFDLVTDEQRKTIAKALEHSAEMQSMAFGHAEAPPNFDLIAHKKSSSATISELENDVELLRKCLAGHIGVQPRQISIHYGRLLVNP